MQLRSLIGLAAWSGVFGMSVARAESPPIDPPEVREAEVAPADSAAARELETIDALTTQISRDLAIDLSGAVALLQTPGQPGPPPSSADPPPVQPIFPAPGESRPSVPAEAERAPLTEDAVGPAPAPPPAPPPAYEPEPVNEPEVANELEVANEPAPSPEPAVAPPPSAAEPMKAPDPVFADWGPPGSNRSPSDVPRVQAAAMFGVGASFDETPGGVNPLGFGFGVRGDYRLLPELAVGGRFLYYVGSSATLANADIAMSSWLLAAEASYVFPISGLILEPGLVIGFQARTIDGRAPFADGRAGGFVDGLEDDTDVGFYLAPGAALTVPLAIFAPELEPFFAGGDARFGFVFGDGVSGSFELMVQGGVRFSL